MAEFVLSSLYSHNVIKSLQFIAKTFVFSSLDIFSKYTKNANDIVLQEIYAKLPVETKATIFFGEKITIKYSLIKQLWTKCNSFLTSMAKQSYAHWGNSYTPRCTQLIICYKVVLTGIEPASQSSNLILRRILCHWATETQINLQWKHVMSFSFPTKRYHKSYYPHPESNQWSQIRSPVC